MTMCWLCAVMPWIAPAVMSVATVLAVAAVVWRIHEGD